MYFIWNPAQFQQSPLKNTTWVVIFKLHLVISYDLDFISQQYIFGLDLVLILFIFLNFQNITTTVNISVRNPDLVHNSKKFIIANVTISMNDVDCKAATTISTRVILVNLLII